MSEMLGDVPETPFKAHHTSCRECVFLAPGEACELGRLDIYRKQGVVVDAFDGDEEFPVVNRVCNAWRHREGEWARHFRGKELEQVRKEAVVRVAFVILADEGDWEATVQSCLSQSLLPSELLLVTRTDGSAIRKRMKDAPANWKLVRCLEDDPSPETLTDMAVAQSSSGWYCVLNGGYAPPTFLLERFNEEVNGKLKGFVALYPLPCGNCGFAHTGFHRSSIIGGNDRALVEGRDVTWVWDKAFEWARHKKEPWLVGSAARLFREALAESSEPGEGVL